MLHRAARRTVYLAPTVLLLSFLAASGSPVHAGVIFTFGGIVLPPGGSGFSANFTAPPSPNNDNSTTQSPNAVFISKAFGSVGSLDLEFAVNNSGIVAPGTTEYFFDETNPTFTGATGVTNNTGVDWNDYHFELGFGLGGAFVQANPAAGLDFDTPDMDPTPTASHFTVLNHQAETLDWSGGAILNGQKGFFTYSVDVPDWSQAIPQGFERRDPAGSIIGYRFTVRQTPSIAAAVPEPSTLALTGLGMLGILGWLRKRKKRG